MEQGGGCGEESSFASDGSGSSQLSATGEGNESNNHDSRKRSLAQRGNPTKKSNHQSRARMATAMDLLQRRIPDARREIATQLLESRRKRALEQQQLLMQSRESNSILGQNVALQPTYFEMSAQGYYDVLLSCDQFSSQSGPVYCWVRFLSLIHI